MDGGGAVETKTVSQAEFADMVKASRSAVCQAVASGRFAPGNITSQGFLVVPAALTDWFMNADTRGGKRGEKSPAVPAPELLQSGVSYETEQTDPAAAPDATPAAPGALPPDHIKATPGTLAYERIELMRMKREQMQQEIDEKNKTLIHVDAVASAAFEVGHECREMLKELATLADDLAPITDAEKIRVILREKMTALCVSISAAFGNLAQRAANGEETAEEEEDEPEA